MLSHCDLRAWAEYFEGGGEGGRNVAHMRAMREQGISLLFAVILLLLVNIEAFVLWLFASICVFLDLLHPVPFGLGSLLNKNRAPSLF